MVIKRLSLGEYPRLEIDCCAGDLDVRGLPRQDIALQCDTPSLQVSVTEQTAVITNMEQDCAIRMPEKGHLHIGLVNGQLKLKGVQGTTEIDQVAGDCIAHHSGGFTVGNIGGDVHLRHANSPVALGTIGGNATLRDIDAPVTIVYIGGDFWGRNLPAGLRIEQVNGDLALHTDFAPNSSFQVAVNGNVLFRVPSCANVRFSIPSQVALQVDEELKTIVEGEQQIVMLGTGEAEVRVSTAAGVRIQSDETCDMEDQRAVSFAGNIDAYMTDVSAKIDVQMSQIEVKLNDLPERIRYRVERKLEAAQRKVESALRDAEKAGDAAQHLYCSQVVCTPAREPVSEKERLAILRMLEKGTISVQEAENLLATLEKGV